MFDYLKKKEGVHKLLSSERLVRSEEKGEEGVGCICITGPQLGITPREVISIPVIFCFPPLAEHITFYTAEKCL